MFEDKLAKVSREIIEEVRDEHRPVQTRNKPKRKSFCEKITKTGFRNENNADTPMLQPTRNVILETSFKAKFKIQNLFILFSRKYRKPFNLADFLRCFGFHIHSSCLEKSTRILLCASKVELYSLKV